MSNFRQRFGPHGVSLLLLALCAAMLVVVFRLDADNGIYKNTSNRYRFHAIPVALSHLYHGRAHDYTAHKGLAHDFQKEGDLDGLIAKYADPVTPVGEETYFWAADDRGLSDYVELAFLLHGPEVHSLSKFFFVLLSLSIVFFAVGHWKNHLALTLALLAVIGILLLVRFFQFAEGLPLVDGTPWREQIALYESRIFEILAIVAWLHLALIVIAREPVPLRTWLSALPQAALILFLVHARSSLGWQYLALFCLAAGRLMWLAQRRWLKATPVAWQSFARPALVASLLAASLIGLWKYKHATYHPAYFGQQGARTFWHNALMGLAYHPDLKRELGVSIDDQAVVELVLRRMRETGDRRLRPDWTKDNILCSLGGHGEFDWSAYEDVARRIYFDTWKRKSGRMLACYFWYKPADECRLAQAYVARSWTLSLEAAPAGTIATTGVVLTVLIIAGYRLGRDRAAGHRLRSYSRLGLFLLAFSLIPGTAFYAALSTMSGFFVALAVCVVPWGLRLTLALCRCGAVIGPAVDTPAEPLVPQPEAA